MKRRSSCRRKRLQLERLKAAAFRLRPNETYARGLS